VSLILAGGHSGKTVLGIRAAVLPQERRSRRQVFLLLLPLILAFASLSPLLQFASLAAGRLSEPEAESSRSLVAPNGTVHLAAKGGAGAGRHAVDEDDYLCLQEFKHPSADMPLGDASIGFVQAQEQAGSGRFAFDIIKVGNSFRVVVWHGALSSSLAACDAYRRRGHGTAFSTDEAMREAALKFFFADWFEAAVIPVSPAAATSPRIIFDPFAPLLRSTAFFLFDASDCFYYSRSIPYDPRSRHFNIFVEHLHEGFRHVLEIQEEAHYDYRPMVRLAPAAAPAKLLAHFGRGGESLAQKIRELKHQPGVYEMSLRDSDVGEVAFSGSEGPCSRSLGGWRAVGHDAEQYHSASRYAGYWLTYRGMPSREHYTARPNYQMDFLGRMNFGLQYQYTTDVSNASDATPHAADGCQVSSGNLDEADARSSRRRCVLELFRNKRLYFFGDSHMRIFFYGFLSLIGIDYPADKVWRGDRRDVISEYNLTVMYVASYFLNMSRTTAIDMLGDASDGVVIIAGVGQHHSCHCWPVAKHMAVVRDALDVLLRVSPGRDRIVVWFGVPAQPYNTHLYRKKPVGQGRRDCRNNARHYLYSLFQQREIQRRRAFNHHQQHSTGDGDGRRLPLLTQVDAFKLSIGMQHTSLDGAHYYGWVRDAWLTELVAKVHDSAS
jgi:hypothetical protein